VAQLIRELNSIVLFDKDVCVIQDCTSKILISVSELRGGVYCVKEFATSKIQAFALGSHNLWHDLVRHLSDQVLYSFLRS